MDSILEAISQKYNDTFDKLLECDRQGLLGTPEHDALLKTERRLNNEGLARMKELGMVTGEICPLGSGVNVKCQDCTGWYMRGIYHEHKRMARPNEPGALYCNLHRV